MCLIDLHTHSSCSDGTDSPEELVKKAKQCGLKAIALTDHDSFNGVDDAVKAGKIYGIEIIKGAEISAVENEVKFHILGFFFNQPGKALTDYFDIKQKSRHERIRKICDKLNQIGTDIRYEDVVLDEKDGSPSRANVAKVLSDRGYAKSVPDAFSKYLIKGMPAYVPGMKITPEDAIRLIKENGGKAFLAHLNQIKLEEDELKNILLKLKKAGLSGIEGYYSEYTPEQTERYISYAKELNLKLSGGSDYHGGIKPLISLGKGFGNLEIPYSVLENIKKDEEVS